MSAEFNSEFTPARKKRKPAFIVRTDLFLSDDDGTPVTFVGECWAAITANNDLIANGADIEQVTTAAFRAGFQIAEQPVDA